jgi:resuscitation-promoting factor RpfB
VAIAFGAVYAIGHHAARTDPVADVVAEIPISQPAARLERERQHMILMASASRTLSLVGTPKLATRPAPVASSAAPGTPAQLAPVVAAPAPDPGTAQSIAYNMLASFGWSPKTQYGCLDDIWSRESGWRYNAENASGAYGIPQALPGSKMATAGSDWQTNPATQIKWGLGYIQGRYSSPCDAWAFWQGHGWY